MSTPTLTQSEIFATIKPEYSNHAIASGLASGLLTPDDAGLILEFIAEKRASVGICIGRCSVCDLAPAVYLDCETDNRLCEACYAREGMQQTQVGFHSSRDTAGGEV